MKNKLALGVLIAVIGVVTSVSSFIYASTLKIDIPTDGYRTGLDILLLQFNESKMLIPFIFGIILVVLGLILFLKEINKKKK